MKEVVKDKILKIGGVTLLFIGIPWIVYLINNKLLGGILSYGIEPRTVEFTQLFGISFSWLFHLNYEHILGNTLGLIMVLPVIALMEKRPYLIIALCTILGGFFTWCFGTSNTSHIGASGMIFALIGFIFSAATVGKAWRYLIPLVLGFSNYWYILSSGLIPQSEVSFAGHFGGLIAGLLLGFLVSKEQNRKNAIINSYKVQKEKKWFEFWKENPEDKWQMKNILKGNKKYKNY